MSIETNESYRLFIDGKTVASANEEYHETENPATGETITRFAAATGKDVDRAVAAARRALPEWQRKQPTERGRALERLADAVREDAEPLAEVETLDQGKPLSASQRAVEGLARTLEYYAGAADKLEGKSIPAGGDAIDFTVREPYGVSAQIIPWNAPLNLMGQGTAPALVAGNTVVIKPAPTTPLSAIHLARLVKDVEIPDGVINVITGGAEPGAALSAHEGVDTVSFTGSVPTGQAVMESAAETITPVTLELGGKNPAIVMPDADLDEAVSSIQIGIFANAGQICAAADRAIVHESIYDEFVEQIVQRAKSYTLGPGIEDPDMGPLNHAEHYEKVLNYIDLGIEEGATLETGGKPLDREGYFVEPTVFSNVSNDMRIAQEEIFGPVLSVIPFAEREEAIRIANDIELGLTGGVFSRDVKQALNMAHEIDAGSIYVNQWFGGPIGAPFGGFKKSGIGREMGLEAFDSYLQTKNICVNLSER